MRRGRHCFSLRSSLCRFGTSAHASPDWSPDWYLDFAFSEIKALAAAGKLGSERTLIVRTGLDPALQTKAETVIETMLRDKAPAYRAHQAAAVIATTDGFVRAMVGGRDYGESQYNRATEAERQPGSSFKIFVYMAALLTGKYHADTPTRRHADRRVRRLHRPLLRAQTPAARAAE